MLGAGAALLQADIGAFLSFVQKTDLSFLQDFITEESRLYATGEYLLYETNDYGMTIVTDTTERSPTFSLLAFENTNDPARAPALSYFRLPQASHSEAAWQALLLRDPIAIEWDELRAVAGRERLVGFDFSARALQQREKRTAPAKLHPFRIERQGDEMQFSLGNLRHSINVAGLHPLFEHLFLKIALNMHSTLVMGRYGRFESNVMTWVKPSNKKLIDRAIRYVEYLLHHQNIMQFSYADICHQLFEEAERMTPAESVVLMTVESLKKRSR